MLAFINIYFKKTTHFYVVKIKNITEGRKLWKCKSSSQFKFNIELITLHVCLFAHLPIFKSNGSFDFITFALHFMNINNKFFGDIFTGYWKIQNTKTVLRRQTDKVVKKCGNNIALIVV